MQYVPLTTITLLFYTDHLRLYAWTLYDVLCVYFYCKPCPLLFDYSAAVISISILQFPLRALVYHDEDSLRFTKYINRRAVLNVNIGTNPSSSTYGNVYSFIMLYREV